MFHYIILMTHAWQNYGAYPEIHSQFLTNYSKSRYLIG